MNDPRVTRCRRPRSARPSGIPPRCRVASTLALRTGAAHRPAALTQRRRALRSARDPLACRRPVGDRQRRVARPGRAAQRPSEPGQRVKGWGDKGIAVPLVLAASGQAGSPAGPAPGTHQLDSVEHQRGGWICSGSWALLMATHRLLNVLLGALVLSAVIHPAGSVDRTARDPLRPSRRAAPHRLAEAAWRNSDPCRSGFARYGGTNNGRSPWNSVIIKGIFTHFLCDLDDHSGERRRTFDLCAARLRGPAGSCRCV